MQIIIIFIMLRSGIYLAAFRYLITLSCIYCQIFIRLIRLIMLKSIIIPWVFLSARLAIRHYSNESQIARNKILCTLGVVFINQKQLFWGHTIILF